MGKTEISRRRFLRMTGLTAAAAGAASVAFPHVITTAKGAANELVFVGFGGGYQEGQTKALFEPFEKETGIKVVQTTGVDIAKLRAQVQSKNVEWDLISIPDRLRYTAVKDGLLREAQLRDDQRQGHPEGPRHRVRGRLRDHPHAAHLQHQGLSARQGAEDVDGLLGPGEGAGARAACTTPRRTSLEFALIADGVPKDKLYPLDVTAGLQELRPHQARR